MSEEKNNGRKIFEMVLVAIIFYLFSQTPVGGKIASVLGFASNVFVVFLVVVLLLAFAGPILKAFYDFFNK